MHLSPGALVAHLFESVGDLVAPNTCVACDAPIPSRIVFCSACAATLERAPKLGAIFAYGGAVAAAIARLKYGGRSDIAPRLGRAMAGSAPASDVVVPVPLHPRRLVERGFNQAALLAGPIARALGARHFPRALARTIDTPPQVSFDRARRRANVSSAFALRDVRCLGQSVLVVDDVRTTGATLAACVRCLKGAGAGEVRTLVLASRD